MNNSTKKALIIVAVTFIAAFVGFIASSISLPMITSQFALLTSLSCIENGIATCFGASDLISWMAIIVTFATSAIVLLSMTRENGALEGERKRVAWALIASMITIPAIILSSWGYLLVSEPALITSIPAVNKVSNFLSWPSLAIFAIGGDPQIVWIIAEIVFACLFLLAYRLIRRSK